MLSFLSRSRAQEISLTISAKTFIKVLVLVLATIVLSQVAHRASFVLTLIVVALFFAFALNAPVTWLASRLPGKLRDSRSSATALSFLIVLLILAAFLISVVPPTVRQTQSLVENAPATIQQLRYQYHNVDELVVRYHLQGQVEDLTRELTTRLRSASATAFTAVTSLLTSVFSFLTVLVLVFMMLVEGPGWLRFTEQVVPARRREHFVRLRRDMYKAIRGYVNGQVALALIASFLLLPGLLAFHVNYPFALMAVVFVCGLIPMVGHTIGAIIVTFVALFHSPYSAIGILLYYILYQQIENYLIQPRLQANTTNLSPLIVLISVLVGAAIGGLVGGLIAIPVAACLRVLILDYLGSRREYVEASVAAETE